MRRRVLVVNNSKNPAHNTGSMANYNKLGEEAPMGWCPGLDDGSHAETNSKMLRARIVMGDYRWLASRTSSQAHHGDIG